MVPVEDQVQNMEAIEKFMSSQKSFLGGEEDKLEFDIADFQELRRNLALSKESVKLAEKCLTSIEERSQNRKKDVCVQQEAIPAVSRVLAEVKAFARSTAVSHD